MRPTDILRDEHRHILTALSVLGVLGDRAEHGRDVPAADVARLVEFFRSFADRCHHEKEEHALFPALEARGLQRRAGPVGVMMREHEEGRGLLRVVAECAPGAEGDAAARARFAYAVRSYDDLLGGHIHKENEILFHMAEGLLDDADDARITTLFARYDTEELGAGERDRLLGTVADLSRSYL
jgi:hemerythrin-like domain-containing protein